MPVLPAVADRPWAVPRPQTVGDAMITTVKRHGPATTVRDLRVLFVDGHVHAALIVDGDRLLAVVDRDDVVGAPESEPAAGYGRLGPRVAGPEIALDDARRQLLADGRRRLAVVDGDGALLGLLCLKRTRSGFCTDDGVRARAATVRPG